MKKKRQRKNCPECIYLGGNSGACLKNPERDTYNVHTLPEEMKEREWCPDMKKRRK
ncbi:MAG: hypothetical protein ACTSX1_12030 [Candidatus Heimdallarchaeaceae archaeon]